MNEGTVGNDRLEVRLSDSESRSAITQPVKERIAERYGVDPDRIMVLSLHGDKHGFQADVMIKGGSDA